MYLLRQLLYRLAGTLRACQERGWRAGFVELGQIVGRIFYQRAEYVIMANELSSQVLLPDPKPDLTIRQVTVWEEIASLSQIADSVDVVRFHEMFDNGSIVFVAFQDGRPAGYCWISQEIHRSVNRAQPPLRSGDACVHDLFVSPEYRGRGVGKALILYRLWFLCEHGYDRAIAVVVQDNVAALELDKKTGYSCIGRMTHTRVLFWDYCHYDLFDV
jgi:GNAT superfamily N-acetyltransferase